MVLSLDELSERLIVTASENSREIVIRDHSGQYDIHGCNVQLPEDTFKWLNEKVSRITRLRRKLEKKGLTIFGFDDANHSLIVHSTVTNGHPHRARHEHN